jgi:acyl dehydratase
MGERLLKAVENYVMHFEDVEVGDRFETSGRTITEADIVNFAGLSADYNSLHVDAEFAATTQHGQRIAHGLLVLAITSGLTTRLPLMKFLEPSIIGLANLECRWLKPSRIGDTIHAVVEIAEKIDGRKPDRGTMLMKRLAVNQHGETVMESAWKIVVRRRPS